MFRHWTDGVQTGIEQMTQMLLVLFWKKNLNDPLTFIYLLKQFGELYQYSSEAWDKFPAMLVLTIIRIILSEKNYCKYVRNSEFCKWRSPSDSRNFFQIESVAQSEDWSTMLLDICIPMCIPLKIRKLPRWI